MRTSVSALALFRRSAPAGRVEYLAQWNEGWHAFHFIGGHKRDSESFCDCCVREVSEELGLLEGRDFRIASERRNHLRYIHWSERAQTDTAYTVELFDAELLPPAAASVESDANNRWLTESDIRAGRCRDGRAVSPTMLRILSLAGLTPDEFDLFVSYAHSDDGDGWIGALLDAVRAEHHTFTSVPLRIFFDREAIRDMADWEHRILIGLRSAKVMLAVLSPAYVASAFCRREWQTYLDHELALALPGDGITPLYTVTVPGFEGASEAAVDKMLANLSRRQYLDVRPWRAEGIAALRREDVRLRLRELDNEIDQRLRRAARVAASPIFNLPAHNRNFVGRQDELRQLREILACNRIGAIAAVRGLGGIGKTALAYEYAHAFAEFYPGGRFVLRVEGAADFRAVVVDQLRDELGVELTDDEKKSYDLSFPRLWNVLKGRGRSLLVLDNLDQPELLAGAKQRGILPAGDAVHVAATTRLEADRLEDRQLVQCLLVDALPAEDGLELLKRFREPAGDAEWKAALALVHRLGGHALALEVVGVFLWKNPEICYADYLARLEAEGAGAVEGAAKGTPVEQISRHPEKFIGRLLEPTLATLSAVEMRVLEYAARLPAEAVPLPWLEALVRKDMAEALTKRPGYPNPWLETMRRLDGLRLLVIDKTEPRLGRMHRLVRDVVIARMGVEAGAERLAAATTYALERAKFLCNGWVDRAVRWEIEPVHFLALELLRDGDTRGADLANWIGNPMGELGRMVEKRSMLLKAIAIQERAYEPDHPILATSYSNLARVERDLGNPTEARKLLHRAISIQERVYEPNDPILATSYSNLAQIERALGKLSEARQLFHKAIAIHERAYGRSHPILAVSYSNLALVEQDAGNLAHARQLLHKAIAIDERAYEPNHPTLAIRYTNLALVEQDLGNPTEARQLLHKSIAINECVYESNHPTLANNYSKLAQIERDLGNLLEARQLLHKAIAIQERVYEPNHPTLAVSCSNLALVERDLGNLADARQLLHKAIAIDEHAYEANHPTLAIRYTNLALVEQDLGNLAQARQLLHKSIAINERAYGPNHPTLARNYSNLALVERDLGKPTEARQLLHKAIAIQENAFEPNHPALAISYWNLAQVECQLHNPETARLLVRRAYCIWKKCLGEQHHLTRQSRHWLIDHDPDFSAADDDDA
jgi:tetratricopeptide (TPR) repeat protein